MDRYHESIVIFTCQNNMVKEQKVELLATTALVNHIPEREQLAPESALEFRDQDCHTILLQRFSVKLLSDDVKDA